MDEKYVVLNGLIAQVKGDWTARHQIKLLSKAYQPFVLKVAERVFYDYYGSNERNEIIQTSHSFFLQLLWEYKLESPVNFNTYLQRKLYYRVKMYYKKDIDIRMADYDPDKDLPGVEKENQHMTRNGKSIPLCPDPQKTNNFEWQKISKSLPEIYLDVIIATVYLGMSQTELAKIFQLPQPYISRIKYLAAERISRVYRELKREEQHASIPG